MSLIGNVVSKVGSFYMSHSTMINTTGIIVGVGVSAYSVGKASIKASKILEEYKKEKEIKKVPIKETIKKTWKTFIPSGLVILSTISLVVLNNYQTSHKILEMTSKITGLAGICANKDILLKNYKDACKEVLKDNDKIKEINKKAEEKNDDCLLKDASKRISNIKIKNDKDFICVDFFTGREFISNRDKLDKIEALMQKNMFINSGGILNELFELFELDDTDVGNDFGWYEGDEFSFTINSRMQNGRPVAVIRYPMPCQLF